MKCSRLTGALRVAVRTNRQDTPVGRDAYNDVIDAINAGHDGNATDCPVCTKVKP